MDGNIFDFLVEDGDEVRLFIEKRELIKGTVVVTTTPVQHRYRQFCMNSVVIKTEWNFLI